MRRRHRSPQASRAAIALLAVPALVGVTPRITAAASTRIEAPTRDGPVIGLDDGSTTAFLGIPYAAPPVGPLRFRPPDPPVPWRAPRDATRFGPPCPQTAALGTPSDQEDCLTLNVFRPDGADHRTPVLVFLFGGSFTWGSAGRGVPPFGPDYDGRRLAAQTRAVIVTVNYRLGILGFLASPVLDATDPRGVSGNYGLLDQQAALRWVHANAAVLGFDATRVTLFGQSAGAVSVAEQIASPGADGLFGPVLLESPGALPGLSLASLETADAAILDQTGCAAAPDKAGCLRSVPVASLLASRVTIGPAVDGKVIPQPPAMLLPARSHDHAPFVEITDRNEGTFFVAHAIARLGHAPTAGELQATLADRFGDAGASAIETEYADASASDPAGALAAIETDEFFACPAAALHAELRRAGVPVLQAEFAQPHPVLDYPVPIVPDLDPGDPHTAELAYVFEQDGAGTGLPTGPDGSLAKGIGDALASLAGSGPAEDPALLALPAKDVVVVAADPTISDAFEGEHHCAFWSASGLVPHAIERIE